VQHLAAAELVHELGGAEVALVHAPARAVVQRSLLHLAVDVGAFARGVDDDELERDTAGLGEEALALRVLEMTVEETREETVERPRGEREVERVTAHECGVRGLALGLADHPRRLVETDDVAVEMPRQEARSARDVEGARGRQRRDDAEQPHDLVEPIRAVSVLESAAPEPHVVVLRRSRVVVGLHAPYSSRVLVLESVPNFSEGRDRATIDAIGGAIERHARLLDVHSDEDHNRSVFTLVAEEEALADALVAAVAVARDRIDLRAHAGAHPRIGAADVVPVVPIVPEDQERARACAGAVARRIGQDLGLPVFLYGELAPGRGPAYFRHGGIDELQRRLDEGELTPDFGPPRLDERAGGVIVGARRPLIAFNVNLRGATVEIAREIASRVRERDGGFPGVRALGFDLPSAGVVQVSMNVEDWEAAALDEIVARVQAEAEARGAEVAGAELVGLMPAGAAVAAAGALLRIDGFDASRVLELRLLEDGGR